jgi:hypothetical protein
MLSEENKKRNGIRRGLLFALLVTVSFISSTPITEAQDPGCNFIGHSACGGTDAGQCISDERFYTEQCSNGQVNHKCFIDDHCAQTSKGRVYIGGTWQQGQDVIHQQGDNFTITGGSFGTATGHFTGPNTIDAAWPVANGAFSATVASDANRRGTQINWNRPPGNIWRRP